jgi:hypothetical protein
MNEYRVSIEFTVEAKSEKAAMKLVDRVQKLVEKRASLVEGEDKSLFSATVAKVDDETPAPAEPAPRPYPPGERSW